VAKGEVETIAETLVVMTPLILIVSLLTIIIHSILFSVHSTPSTKRSFPPSIPPPLAN